MAAVEQYKEEIVNKYIEIFKKELNLFEKLMVLPIETNMKKILKSEKKIQINDFLELEDLGFRRKVLGVKIFDKKIFDGLTTKIFKFLKKKQEKIIKAQTEGRLSELLSLIIEGKLDDLDDSVDNNAGSKGDNGGNNPSGNGGDNKGGDSGNGGDENGNNNGDDGNNNSDDNNSADEKGDDNKGEDENNKGDGKDKDDGKDKENSSHAVEVGAASGVGLAAAYHRTLSFVEKKMGINRLKDVPTEFDGDRTKKMMDGLADQMDEQLRAGVKMNRVQKNVYKKSIEQFRNAAKSLDGDTAEAFKARQKMSDRLPPNFLKSMNIKSKVLDLIDALPDDELKKIVGKSEDEIVDFLKVEHNIEISKEFAKNLKIAENTSEIRQLTKIARNGKKLSNVVKGIKGMGVVTFLFAGVDLWCYIDSDDDAKLVSKINEVRGKVLKDQAQMQLIIGMGALGLEALSIAIICAAGGSVAGPVGTSIGIAIGVLAAAASILSDSLYYDNKAFYAQNRYDYINKKRTEIKQSIVQLLQSDSLDMHAGIKKTIKEERGNKSEINTMEDAWEALIYQEEIVSGDFGYLQRYYSSGETEQNFLNSLTEGEQESYKAEKSVMEKIISTRMEYIKQFISKNKDSEEYKKMKESLDRKKGLSFVEQVLADSKVYSYLKSEDESPYISDYKNLSVEGYKQAYKSKLSSEYPKEFAQFEKIRQENALLLEEICRGVDLSKSGILSDIEDNVVSQYSESEALKIKKNIDFIEKYYEYIKLGVSNESNTNIGLSDTTFDYGYIEQVLLNLDSINSRPKWTRESALRYLGSEIDNRIEEWNYQVSDSVFQNIIYGIAKEIHGYTGRNDALELVNFYTGNGDITGIYMDDKRKISKVTGFLFFGAKDGSIENPNNITKEQILEELVKEVELDSDVEVADDIIIQEFRNRVETIVNREFSYREKKKDYENKLVNYVKSQGESDDYIELPNDLVLECRKAGIGDVSKFLFKYSGGKIYALGRGDMVNNTLNLNETNITINYESMLRLRENYTPEELNLIQKVDDAENLLLKIRRVEGSAISGTKEDDLDIPVELERIMSQKSIEWNQIKESFLYMSPYKSRDYLLEKARQYHDFFEGMYIGLLSEITRKNKFLNSNDVDEASEFLQAASFIGSNLSYVEKGKIKYIDIVDVSIAKYLDKLIVLYTDKDSNKTIKDLLLSEDEVLQARGQELLTQLYKMCLEQTVIEYDSEGNIKDFHMGDMDDDNFEKVKQKMKEVLDKDGFNIISSRYSSASLPTVGDYTIREVKHQEEVVHDKVKEIVDKIINAMNHIDRAGMRKNPKFVADEVQSQDGKITGTFSSWGYKEKMSIIIDGDDIKGIKIDGFNRSFNDIEEGIRTANLINFIKNNVKENPYGKDAKGRMFGTYGYYHWSYGGDLERDIVNNPIDVNILDVETLEKYYHSIWKTDDFLAYINGFVR